MSPEPQSRIDIAQGLGAAYAELEGVAAVMLAGSVSRGHADRFSDIELGVFWTQAPSDEQRHQVIDAFGVDKRVFPYETEYFHWFDEFFIGRAESGRHASGLLVEVVHTLVTDYERFIDEAIQQFNPSFEIQNQMAGLFDCIPLHGEELLNRWKEEIKLFPRELKVALVRKHAQIDHFWKWRMYLARGTNLTSLYSDWSAIENKLLYTLCGLNGVYCFGLKWRAQLIERFEIAPADLSSRLNQVFTESPSDGAKILTELIEETYSLIDTHLPEVNVEWLRTVFRYEREDWV